jgi:hypothetical protein
VVDDSIVRFKLVGSNSVPAPIGSQIEMRLVHIFETRSQDCERDSVRNVEGSERIRKSLELDRSDS